ncbi:28S ribosomal protein S11, mitochondrial [Athalia rosae]|uniref:28S ribosomal protein S11, mitochondrial n=1 Tax=Athalia rosae TaxID=37344 RepID=UPI0020339C56|nr:28S ribosomal protein S11, mitochondrial [Athalia rosae]
MLRSAVRFLASPCIRNKLVFQNPLRETTTTLNISRNLHATAKCQKAEDKKAMLASLPPKDEGTAGEKSIQIDQIMSKTEIFPDENTPFKLFDGTPFKDLPICNIRVSPNNTIITISDGKGEVHMLHSAGIEGFKNARKGTNIAAQATATNLSIRAIQKGIKTVRVRVRGIGPGRMSAIKGLQIGGMNIVSITDSTRVSWNPPRPRKQRRL